MTESTALVTVLNKASNLAKIEKALPVGMKTREYAETCVQVCLLAINKNPALAKCSQTSILQCVVEAAGYGLQIDNVLGHAYLVPYNTKVGDKWVNSAQMQVGYKGLLYLARKGDPDIENIECNIVHERDMDRDGHFSVILGDNPSIEHTPNWNKAGWAKDATNKPIASYSIVTYRNGFKSHHFMTIDEVFAIRDKSAKNADKESSPWNKHTEAMIKKTVLRQHCKLLNLSKEDTRYQTAIEQDELRDMGVMQGDKYVQREVKSVGGDADFDSLNERLSDPDEYMGEEPPQEDTLVVRSSNDDIGVTLSGPASNTKREIHKPKPKPKAKAKAKPKKGPQMAPGSPQTPPDEEKILCPMCERKLGVEAFDGGDLCAECDAKAQAEADELFD